VTSNQLVAILAATISTFTFLIGLVFFVAACVVFGRYMPAVRSLPNNIGCLVNAAVLVVVAMVAFGTAALMGLSSVASLFDSTPPSLPGFRRLPTPE
jgi:hypothetical protein